jgi:hypothetical protein
MYSLGEAWVFGLVDVLITDDPSAAGHVGRLAAF